MLQGVLQRGIDGYGRLRPLWTCWTVVALGILGLGLRAGSVLGNRLDCSRNGLGLGDRFSSSGGRFWMVDLLGGLTFWPGTIWGTWGWSSWSSRCFTG